MILLDTSSSNWVQDIFSRHNFYQNIRYKVTSKLVPIGYTT